MAYKDECTKQIPEQLRCERCGKRLTEYNCTAITGTCDGCLADEAAEWNYSMDNPHNEPY